MLSSDSETWGPASGVGLTATEAAAARAVASRRARPLIDDPFAEPLVRAVGVDILTELIEFGAEGGQRGFPLPRMVDWVSARTWFFDEYLTEANRSGIRQMVILGAGLDSRAYRLPWAPKTIVYEIDQPGVLGFKSREMAVLGADPLADRRPVAANLSEQWRPQLCRSGFDPTLRTAWAAEGVLPYLAPTDQDAVLADIVDLSAAGSRIALDTVDDIEALASRLASSRGNILPRRPRAGEHVSDRSSARTSYELSAQLCTYGWVSAVSSPAQLFARCGLMPLGEAEELYRVINLITAW